MIKRSENRILILERENAGLRKKLAELHKPEQTAKDLLEGFYKGLEGDELSAFSKRSWNKK